MIWELFANNTRKHTHIRTQHSDLLLHKIEVCFFLLLYCIHLAVAVAVAFATTTAENVAIASHQLYQFTSISFPLALIFGLINHRIVMDRERLFVMSTKTLIQFDGTLQLLTKTKINSIQPWYTVHSWSSTQKSSFRKIQTSLGAFLQT